MRKILLLCFVCFIANGLYAQKKYEKHLIGVWKVDVAATEALMKEKKPELKGAMPEMEKKLLGSLRIEFQKTGKCISSVGDKSREGTWTVVNSVLTTQIDGAETALTIVGTDILEVTLHDTKKNTYLVMENIAE